MTHQVSVYFEVTPKSCLLKVFKYVSDRVKGNVDLGLEAACRSDHVRCMRLVREDAG